MRHRTLGRCLRRVVFMLLVLALVIGQKPWIEVGSAYATPAGAGDLYRAVLGDAVNFGIVTQEFSLRNGDAQTNVAAQVGTSLTQTGNDLTNDAEQTFILGSVPEAFRIKGNDAYVRTDAADAGKVMGAGNTTLTVDTSMSGAELSAEVQQMLDYTAAQSAQLAAQEPNASVDYNASTQKYVLDVRGSGQAVHYVSVDGQTYEGFMREPSKLQIGKDEGQTIVINVMDDVSTMQKYDINGLGSDSFLDQNAGTMPQSLIWNFAGAQDLTIAGTVTGVVLAPQAQVHVAATSSGWLVAQRVEIGSGEWHNVYQGVEHLREGSVASFGAYKLVDGADAAVDGFEFVLELETDEGWREVASAYNAGANVNLGEQVYDETTLADGEEDHTLLYRISERQGSRDEAGVSYMPDTNVYYAQVTVTKMVQLLPGGGTKTVYAATQPTYFADEEGTQPLGGMPTFNNLTGGDSETPDDPDENPNEPEEEPDVPGEDPESPSEEPDDPGDDPDGSTDAPDGPSEEPDTPSDDHVVMVRTTKTSLDNPELVLEGATYGLWIAEADGDDTYVGNDTSDDKGRLVFELPDAAENTYYLLEEDAPFGHLVDPYPTDEFSVGHDEAGYYLAHEGDDPSEYVRAAADSTDETTILDYRPTNNPVANRAVHVGVNKLDSTTGEHVAGAELQIIDKETGEVVASWTSEDDTYELKRVLDTERVYVLRETAAPAGYARAQEVEFVIHAEGTETKGEVLTGAAEMDGSVNAYVTDTDAGELMRALVIDLYDDPLTAGSSSALPNTGGTTSISSGALSSSAKGGKALALTSDTAMGLAGIGALALLGLAAFYAGRELRA